VNGRLCATCLINSCCNSLGSLENPNRRYETNIFIFHIMAEDDVDVDVEEKRHSSMALAVLGLGFYS
jgi:hypothetical protein